MLTGDPPYVNKDHEENDVDDFDNTDNFEIEDNSNPCSNLPDENEQVVSDHENTCREVHEGKKPESKINQHIKCSSCGYRTETKDRMNKHITQQHKEQNVKIINCISFTSKQRMKSHIEGKKPLKCNDCGAAFSQKSKINGHIDSVHEGNNPIKCNECDKTFSRKQHLKIHIDSVHEGKKPLKCYECDKTFSLKHHLKKHFEAVHEGRKPFQCKICDSNFSHKEHLKRHIESVHEGKKPFKCNKCDVAFSQKGHMIRHIVSVHRGKI